MTFYDGGERIELSYKSLENWVAKTANFLVDEIEVDEADAIFIDLPAHWLKVVWLLAIWASGCRVAPTRQDARHIVSNMPVEGDDIYCSLQVMGKLPQAPKGFIDFTTEVRKFSDFFNPSNHPTEVEYAEHRQIPPGSRVLFLSDDLSQEQVAQVFAAKSSMVILRNADEDRQSIIKREEKIDYVWD